MSRRGGVFARGRKGATITSTNTGRKQIQVMNRNDDEFIVESNESIMVSRATKNDVDSIFNRQFAEGNKKRGGRKRKQAASAEPNPLDVAQQLQRDPTSAASNRIPRKNQKRNSDESSRSGRSTGTLQSFRQSPSNRVQNAANYALGYASAATNRLRGRFTRQSPGSSRSTPRSNNSDGEVVDLCDDDDDDDRSKPSYQDGDSTVTGHSEDDSSRRSSRASGRTPSSSASSGRSSRVSDGSSSMSRRRSASSYSGESSDTATEDEAEVSHVSSKSRNRFKAPDPDPDTSFSRSKRVIGTSDLDVTAQESDEEMEGPNVCGIIQNIENETFDGTQAERKRKASSKKRPTSNEAQWMNTRKTSPNSSESSSSSSPLAWGGGPKINIRKVNSKKNSKQKIVPGAAIGRSNSHPTRRSARPLGRITRADPTIADPIFEDSDSEVEEIRPRSRLQRKAAATGPRRDLPKRAYGVQPNPYASSSVTSTGTSKARRQSLSRKAKKKASSKNVVDLDLRGDYEYDDDLALADLGGTSSKSTRLLLNAVRIAIGKKVQSKNCKLLYKRNIREGKITLAYIDPNGDRMKHEINLDDASVREMKYCLANDDSIDTVAIDFDETEEMSFLVMQVEPSDANGLSKFPNAYKPSESQTDASKKYIAIEFRSDTDFNRLIHEMEDDPILGAFVDVSSKLKPSQVEEYGSSLLKEAKKERAARESSMVGSPRIRRTRKKRHGTKVTNEIVLVFPFGADEKAIDNAANGLQEAGHMSTMTSMTAPSSVEAIAPAALKSSDDEAAVAPAASNDTDSPDNDAEKDDPGGKHKSRAHFLTIRDEDYDRLQDGEFLNDTLIDFWFQWIWRKERHSASDVHFFTSHFYTTLAKGGPKAVTSWTAKKNIDIFTKKFIFIPINQSLHWSLCVVVNPAEIRNEIEECDIEIDDDSLFPCILFFDSLKAHRKNIIAKNVRKWLNSEWKRLKMAKAQCEEDPFTSTTMRVFDPRVPYQDNSWDCGVFVCRYGFAIYLLRGRDVTYADRNDNFRSLVTESEEFNFDRHDIARIRLNLKTLIDNLSAMYKVWKKLQDEAEKKEEEEESKKAVARRLLLENADADGTAKKDENAAAEEDELVSPHEQTSPANVEEGKAASSTEEATAAVDTSFTHATLPTENPSSPTIQGEGPSSSKSPKSDNVQATETAETSSSPKPDPMEIVPEKNLKESTMLGEDVEMAGASDGGGEKDDEVMKEAESPTLESRVREVEFAEAVQDVRMAGVEVVEGPNLSIVKMEEDQYDIDAQNIAPMEDSTMKGSTEDSQSTMYV